MTVKESKQKKKINEIKMEKERKNFGERERERSGGGERSFVLK